MLQTQVDERTTTLLLDRPERAHAYDQALLRALDAALDEVRTPTLVLGSTGEGAFCAGADLKDLPLGDPLRALDLLSQRVFERLARAPFITIAAVQGPAVGGGFELALACDLRVVGPRARMWLPETGLGLVPAAGGCTRLPRLVGLSRAKEVILGGRVVDANAALSWGLAARQHEQPLTEALAWAHELSRRDPTAQRLAKCVLDETWPTSASLTMERVTEALLYTRKGHDG
ncbi:enoyl-CoA hydratase/isomerase family protein [Myxococcota bacterium]|nr:enoyl-CoA hydratase/isomerase family protein [Myxococcota bacterium]